MPFRKIDFTDEINEKVCRLYQEGKSQKAVAAIMGFTITPVRRILLTNKIQMREAKRVKKDPPKERICLYCGYQGPSKNFRSAKQCSGGRSNMCKKCAADMAKIKGPERVYGIKWDDYQKLHDKCDGLCMICGGKPERFRLSIDHCHQTGKIRGLLCSRCNFGIGSFRDNPEIIKKALEYLYANK